MHSIIGQKDGEKRHLRSKNIFHDVFVLNGWDLCILLVRRLLGGAGRLGRVLFTEQRHLAAVELLRRRERQQHDNDYHARCLDLVNKNPGSSNICYFDVDITCNPFFVFSTHFQQEIDFDLMR